MDGTYSDMIEYLNFCSLLAFQNSKADLYNRLNMESALPEPYPDRTLRGNVPLDAFVKCEICCSLGSFLQVFSSPLEVTSS